MAGGSRWRLIELKQRREAVRDGIELLDRKREALVRELALRRLRAGVRWKELAGALAGARDLMARAFDELGQPACEAAALAQCAPVSLDVIEERLLGVALPRIQQRWTAFEIVYATGGTSATLDRAAEAFVALLPAVMDIASEEAALRNLTAALRRTLRTFTALERVVLPELETEIRGVADELEEEERDERSRWRRRPVPAAR